MGSASKSARLKPTGVRVMARAHVAAFVLDVRCGIGLFPQRAHRELALERIERGLIDLLDDENFGSGVHDAGWRDGSAGARL